MSGKVVIDEVYCKGCGLCVRFCPRKVLAVGRRVGRKGYVAPTVAEAGRCSGCGMCELICPELAVTVEESKKCDAR